MIPYIKIKCNSVIQQILSNEKKMQNNTTTENSTTTKYYKYEQTRTSLDPIFPPSAKLHDTNYSSSTVSINMTSDEIEDTDQQKMKLTQEEEEEEEEPEEKPLTRMERFKMFVKYVRPMAVMLFFDVGLPLAIYYILKIWLSVLIALILSGIPPLLRVFYVFWKRRQVDILGCIFVVSFILSAVLSVISGKRKKIRYCL
jgi:cation transport ATPase